MSATLLPQETPKFDTIKISPANGHMLCTVKQCTDKAVQEFDLGYSTFRLCEKCRNLFAEALKGPAIPAQSA